MRFNRVLARVFFPLACFLLAAVPARAGDDWRPIDPGHLAMKEPVVEKDADAEALFWEVRINDAAQDLVFTHYIRIKCLPSAEKNRRAESTLPLAAGTG